MEDTWLNRDLPVLKAAVEIYDRTGHIRADAIEKAVGFDTETVQRALRALYTEPYFQQGTSAYGGRMIFVGVPTSDAYRVAGKWPTPENLLERLIAAFDAAGEDDDRDEPERSRFKQAAAWLGSAASQVAISALGGAGGHMLYS
ncbi:hypothetical protein [Mycobacterium avium]|uniref:hypothetical protein n=1 Tax=Mycobacterium avium TaxID=1764 RepID=UPI0007A0CD7E|nr:hypothetical protein [Mycobacterium avium]